MAKSLNGDPLPAPDPDKLVSDRCVKFVRSQKEFTGVTVVVYIKPTEDGDDVHLFGDPDLPNCAILACVRQALTTFDPESEEDAGEDEAESE